LKGGKVLKSGHFRHKIHFIFISFANSTALLLNWLNMVLKLLPVLKQFIIIKPFKYISGIRWFYKDYQQLKKENNPAFIISDKNLYPCLEDKTVHTPLDPIYFYQNAWAASKIFEYQPTNHVDIGSHVGFVGIVSQFVPTTMIDLRPIDIELKGLQFIKGDILQLPITDHSLESVSSICVIEHIGLGRYGDTVDAFGSEKAITELQRIVKSNGNILFTVPIDRQSNIYFNAHRSFTRNHILTLFKDCTLLEEKYIYGSRMFDNYEPGKGFGTGLFHFRKN
jgi:hypothetical protein